MRYSILITLGILTACQPTKKATPQETQKEITSIELLEKAAENVKDVPCEALTKTQEQFQSTHKEDLARLKDEVIEGEDARVAKAVEVLRAKSTECSAQSSVPTSGMPAIQDVNDCSCGDKCCPISTGHCIEFGFACVLGDHEACCFLGLCGSTNHCEEGCQSSCCCQNIGPGPGPGPIR